MRACSGHGPKVGKRRQEVELAADGFDGAVQSRQQHVAAPLLARDGLLLDAELSG